MDAYQYDELPPDAFRYLVLLPGVNSDPLRCSLHSSTIDQAHYESVSYVWGTDQRDHDIFCDGRVLKITPNLYRVLLRVRLPDTPRTLWADSICINQEDLREKGRQVTIMGQIYRNAERVLICIGTTGEEHGANVRSLLKDVSEMIDIALIEINRGVEEMKRNGEWQPQWSPWDWFPFSDADAPVLSDPRWASLNVLVEQEWFQRGWVVREAGLARQGLVIWGRTEFLWDDLMRALVWRHRRAVKTIVIPAEDRFRSHLEAYEAQHQDIICVFYQAGSWKPCSLLDYIHFARALRLKDPRDRIYAFLDLAEDPRRQLRVVPNYNDTPLKVYRDFATHYVCTTGDVDLLHYVKHDEDSLKSGFMTWAPDWSKKEDNFIGFVSTADNYPPLRSSTGKVSEPKLIDGTTLEVKAVIIDSVRFASDVFQSSTTTSTVLFRLWTLVRQSTPETPYSTANILEAFFDALAMSNYYGDLTEWHQTRRIYIATFERLTTQMQESEAVSWDADEIATLESSKFHGFISSLISGKRVIVTERGYIGLVPDVTQQGNLCGIIFGCSSPCLLRTTSSDDCYAYLGSGFILGKAVLDLDEHGLRFYSCLGVEDSKDWLEWDVEEQDIYLL
ncbi:hypothetical protein BU25DRAFT_255291 [Macroventuria anomochaeta]|uniref:Uncharacterized protein n=1 Tax=Macroventuria anomochaeta TaxID=301207 RepID=A0ACB6S7M8_9PLEO|nr:uncharacterized protein BU25DRAFT_255291 [Macroventuria anomochaeta]KAF2630270.1 hypothetical protein BU25DRAFT_255291 [Macroventuria anomochaeta]